MGKKKKREDKPQPTVRCLDLKNLRRLEPKTDHQQEVFEAWRNDRHLALIGAAGAGKTVLALYLALREVLEDESGKKKIVVVRSAVPTRDMGFMPGNMAEKEAAYIKPYQSLVNWLFDSPTAWTVAVNNHLIEFMTTSYVRGITLDDTAVILEEAANMTFHELDSMITRLGDNSRLVLTGDTAQTDLEKEKDKQGFTLFQKILREMKKFTIVEFTWEDCVRAGIVRDYLMTKAMLKI